MRVALVGHACSPVLGSEPGLTWNWARALAARHDVSLFTHPQFRADIDAELARHPLDSLKVGYVNVDSLLDFWRPEKGERGIRVHYRMWQKAVLNALREAHCQRSFDLVHHVSWGSLQQPPLVWKTGLPFVWGPIGGGQVWPGNFRGYGGDTLSERARGLLVRLTRFNPIVMRAVSHADLILTTNRETDQLVRRLGGRRVELYFDNGVSEDMIEPKTPLDDAGRESRALKIVWAGRCENRKGLPLGLKALARVNNPSITMTVAGDGPDLREYKALSERLGLARRVTFLGRVARPQVLRILREADAFLFTSLRDSTGSVVLEAAAKSLPIVTLDHQGIGCLITEETGIKVPVARENETISAMGRSIERLAEDPEGRRRLGAGAMKLAVDHLWSRRAEQMGAWYEEVLDAHRSH